MRLRQTDPENPQKRLNKRKTVNLSQYDSQIFKQQDTNQSMDFSNAEKKHFKDDKSKINRVLTEVCDNTKPEGIQTFHQKYQQAQEPKQQPSIRLFEQKLNTHNLTDMIEKKTTEIKGGKQKDFEKLEQTQQSWRVMGRSDTKNMTPQPRKSDQENDGNPITGEGYKNVTKFQKKRIPVNEEGRPILRV